MENFDHFTTLRISASSKSHFVTRLQKGSEISYILMAFSCISKIQSTTQKQKKKSQNEKKKI